MQRKRASPPDEFLGVWLAAHQKGSATASEPWSESHGGAGDGAPGAPRGGCEGGGGAAAHVAHGALRLAGVAGDLRPAVGAHAWGDGLSLGLPRRLVRRGAGAPRAGKLPGGGPPHGEALGLDPRPVGRGGGAVLHAVVPLPTAYQHARERDASAAAGAESAFKVEWNGRSGSTSSPRASRRTWPTLKASDQCLKSMKSPRICSAWQLSHRP